MGIAIRPSVSGSHPCFVISQLPNFGQVILLFSLSFNFLIWKMGTVLTLAANILKLTMGTKKYGPSGFKGSVQVAFWAHLFPISIAPAVLLSYLPGSSWTSSGPSSHRLPLLPPETTGTDFFLVTWIRFTVWDTVLGSAEMSPPWRGCHSSPYWCHSYPRSHSLASPWGTFSITLMTDIKVMNLLTYLLCLFHRMSALWGQGSVCFIHCLICSFEISARQHEMLSSCLSNECEVLSLRPRRQ